MSKDPIAAGIRSLMSERGLIQKAVAFRAGYTQQQFNDMLNDRKTIKATDIVPISRAIGVSVQEIYDAGARFMPRYSTRYCTGGKILCGRLGRINSLVFWFFYRISFTPTGLEMGFTRTRASCLKVKNKHLGICSPGAG